MAELCRLLVTLSWSVSIRVNLSMLGDQWFPRNAEAPKRVPPNRGSEPAHCRH